MAAVQLRATVTVYTHIYTYMHGTTIRNIIVTATRRDRRAAGASLLDLFDLLDREIKEERD